MTNNLVGEVYAKIIEEVVAASSNDFEESGVGSTALQELQQEWQAKLSQRKCAQMPWDPKPVPAQQAPSNGSVPTPTSATPVAPPSSYTAYDASQTNPQIKTEPGSDAQQLNGVPNGNYPPGAAPAQGGLVRAQQLVQQYENTASMNAMQQRGGLALPGQQAKPQGYPLPPQGLTPTQQQQYQAAMRQQQMQQQPQGPPRVKIESNGAQISQASPDQKAPPNPAYAQTDGADEAMEEWRTMLARRRAAGAEQAQHADRMMHEQIMQLTRDLSNGLLLPSTERKTSRLSMKRRSAAPSSIGVASSSSVAASLAPPSSTGIVSIPQLDGDADDEGDAKPDVKDDEDDENAINSDLDDPDDDDQGSMNDDEDVDGDQILCTYDKVQRVKNKWKCTLKDGAMTVGGREWVFHKGMGEFEW